MPDYNEPPLTGNEEFDRYMFSAHNKLFKSATDPTDVATADADATYGTEERDLINELKTNLNALLAALRNADIIS